MITLGSKVRDTLTGFTGTATGRTEWLYGCTRICIEPNEMKDGKPIEGVWFDEQRIEVIKPDTPKVSPDSSARKGGPQSDPHRSADPSR
jgi:hypothetical protein